MVLGQCKDVSLKFTNNTGYTITIPSEGHRVKNPGGVEGWNNLQLGSSICDLAPGATSRGVLQNLNIKCVKDADFEIHYSSCGYGDQVDMSYNVDINDKSATLSIA